MEPASFSLQSTLDESKSVKCLYLDEYDIYDISSLGVNSLDSNDEVASTHQITYNNKIQRYLIKKLNLLKFW